MLTLNVAYTSQNDYALHIYKFSVLNICDYTLYMHVVTELQISSTVHPARGAMRNHTE